jgi:hypothetical protein
VNTAPVKKTAIKINLTEHAIIPHNTMGETEGLNTGTNNCEMENRCVKTKTKPKEKEKWMVDG